MAAEAWENHSLRNKSIIVDLFHGQLKSKVTCKVCGHESVRCDPFFTLSLPLPMERCVSVEVVVMLQDGSVPVKYGLSLDMEDKCSVIPARLARLCGIPPANLVLVDIVQSQIRVIQAHEQKVSWPSRLVYCSPTVHCCNEQVRTLGGTCVFAYEVVRQGEGSTHTAASVARPALSPDTEQSITDIQRSVHSSE